MDLISEPTILDLVGHDIKLCGAEGAEAVGIRARQPGPHGPEDDISGIGTGHHHQLDEFVDLLDVKDGAGELVAALHVRSVVCEHDEQQQARELGAETLQDEVARRVARLGAFNQHAQIRAARALAVAERVHCAVDGEEHGQVELVFFGCGRAERQFNVLEQCGLVEGPRAPVEVVESWKVLISAELASSADGIGGRS